MKSLENFLKTLRSTTIYEKQDLFSGIGQLLKSNAALITVLSLINKCPRSRIIAYTAESLPPKAYAELVEHAKVAISHSSPIQQSIHRDVYIAEKGDVDWLMIIQEGERATTQIFWFFIEPPITSAERRCTGDKKRLLEQPFSLRFNGYFLIFQLFLPFPLVRRILPSLLA